MLVEVGLDTGTLDKALATVNSLPGMYEIVCVNLSNLIMKCCILIGKESNGLELRRLTRGL